MIKLIVEGNLGANAEVKNENGHQFVSMNIAENRRYTDTTTGETKEKTQWISATLNGDGGNLLPYLVKGARVHIIGDAEVRQYHSEKQRALVAGLKVYVREIELVGGTPEAVPRDLYDIYGVAHRVSKYYHVADAANCILMNRAGEQFTVDANGWVSPTNVQATNDQPQEQAEETQPKEQATEAQEQPQQEQTPKEKKK